MLPRLSRQGISKDFALVREEKVVVEILVIREAESAHDHGFEEKTRHGSVSYFPTEGLFVKEGVELVVRVSKIVIDDSIMRDFWKIANTACVGQEICLTTELRDIHCRSRIRRTRCCGKLRTGGVIDRETLQERGLAEILKREGSRAV